MIVWLTTIFGTVPWFIQHLSRDVDNEIIAAERDVGTDECRPRISMQP